MYSIGDKIDNRYLIEEKIGEGGLALVYKGFDEEYEKHVALKILKQEFLQSVDIKNLIKVEAHNMDELNHENICKIKNFSKNNGVIILELLKGQTLDEKMKLSKLKHQEIKDIFIQILHGLKHAHSKSIIHCDLKPSNIFICNDGTVKILDFGISQTIRDAKNNSKNELRGTIEYMAPEIISGGKTSIKSDFYSLGVLLFKMASNRLPYNYESKTELKNKILEGKLDNILIVKSKLEDNYFDCVNLLLKKDPYFRFNSCEEIINFIRSENKNYRWWIFALKYKFNIGIIAVALILAFFILNNSKQSNSTTNEGGNSANNTSTTKDPLTPTPTPTSTPTSKPTSTSKPTPTPTSTTTTEAPSSSNPDYTEVKVMKIKLLGNVEDGEISFEVLNNFTLENDSKILIAKGSKGVAQARKVGETEFLISIKELNSIQIITVQKKHKVGDDELTFNSIKRK